MDLPRFLQPGLALARRGSAALGPVAPLATRLVLGIAFLRTGLGKWQHFANTVQFFTDLGIPLPAANAAMVATVELVGGLCLVVGLGTRISAALLASTMLVALLTADRGSLLDALAFGETGLADVTPLVFLLFLVWLMAHGGGGLGLDRLVFRSRAAAPAAGH